MKIRHFLIFIAVGLLMAGCKPQTVTTPIFNDEIGQVKVEPKATSTQELVEQKDLEVVEIAKPSVVTNKVDDVKEKNNIPIVPNKFDQEIAFVSQAPYAVWDELHEEACEEASMIMVDSYFKKASLTAHAMEQGILNLVKWQEENGYQVDLTAQEASDILNNYFKLTSQTTTDVTIERIKQELINDKIVIVPAAGRELGNPYFQTPGPIYHMLVVKGFDESTKEFITNDPGTKRGKDFRYQYHKLINAIHDWNHQLAQDGMTDDEISQGQKIMILVDR